VRLRDELFLLAHDGAGKPVVHPDSLDVGVAGARLAELVLAGRLVVSRGRVAVAEPTATGEPEADALLVAVLNAPEPPPVAAVLAHLRAGSADRVRDDLLRAGVVTRVSARRFGLVAVNRWPADEEVVRPIMVRVWYAAHGRAQPDPVTATLCGLVHGVLLHEHVFVGMPMTGLAQRLVRIRQGSPGTLREVVTAVAAMVAAQAVAIYR
jgi:hypothetical protein